MKFLQHAKAKTSTVITVHDGNVAGSLVLKSEQGNWVSVDVHHPDISVTDALDALKKKGVLFTSVSMTMQPQNMMEIKIEAVICSDSKESYETALEMHKWLYSPIKGY